VNSIHFRRNFHLILAIINAMCFVIAKDLVNACFIFFNLSAFTIYYAVEE